MKKLILFISLILLFWSSIGIAGMRTPYHSIDKNSFFSVADSIYSPDGDKTIVRTVEYMKDNFVYEYDSVQFGLDDYWQSPIEMFFRKKGDCEDWATFSDSILKHNGQPSETWISWDQKTAHAFTVTKFKKKWVFIDYSIHEGFASKDEAANAFYGTKNLGSVPIKLAENPPPSYLAPDLSPNFANSGSRLKMHAHLMECEGNEIEFLIPAPGENYKRLSNKEAVGILLKTKKHPLGLKAIGFSYSEHGWYSPSQEFNDKMYTFHFLTNRVGINTYTGDYKGIDIDVKTFQFSWLKSYINIRNFGEVMDYKAVLTPISFFEGQIESNDGDIIYSGFLKTNKVTSFGYRSNKDLVIRMEASESGSNFKVCIETTLNTAENNLIFGTTIKW